MLPPNHALRAELNDEVHARPSDALDTPSRISYLALLSEGASRDADLTHAASLIQRLGGRVPERAANHFSVQIGGRTIRWERHTEFVRHKHGTIVQRLHSQLGIVRIEILHQNLAICK